MLALGLLGWALLANKAEQDWTRVASVNGVAIDRAHLRDRVALERFLFEQQSRMIGDARSAGRLTEAEAASQRAALEQAVGDPVVAARSDLVDEELVRQLAAREQVSAATPDPWQELARFLGSGFGRHLRWVKISAPPASPTPTPAPSTSSDPFLPAYSRSSLADATARAAADLAASAKLDAIIVGLHAAGWTADGADRWIGPEGAVDGLDASLVAGARELTAGGMIGPLADRHSAMLVGRLVEIAPADAVLPSRLAGDAATAHVSSDAVADWAKAHALRVALSAEVTARLLVSPVEQVRGQELVVGPANPDGAAAGPWVELASIRLSALGITAAASGPAGSAGPTSSPSMWPPSGPLATLLADLRSRSRDNRVAAFRALADRANVNGSGGSTRSGELGFLGKGDLAKLVSAAVFAPEVASGDIVGPIEIGGEPMLLLVEARYAGSLDHRSAGALVEARAPNADLAALEARLSPADTALVGDSGWFARAEFAADDPTAGPLFGTPKSGSSPIRSPAATASRSFVRSSNGRPFRTGRSATDSPSLDSASGMAPSAQRRRSSSTWNRCPRPIRARARRRAQASDPSSRCLRPRPPSYRWSLGCPPLVRECHPLPRRPQDRRCRALRPTRKGCALLAANARESPNRRCR